MSKATTETKTITTDVEQARLTFQAICSEAASGDTTARWMLGAINESVVIDWITNTMARDDEFALVIGRRLDALTDVLLKVEKQRQGEKVLRKAKTV